MLSSTRNIEELEKLNELVSLQTQENELRLQDKLGKQKFIYNTKKVIETNEETYENLTKSLSETSIENNNQALENLNNKPLEIMIDRGILASYLLSLSKLTNLEITSQFKLVKYSNSKRGNELLIHKTIPVTFFNNLFTFRDTSNEVEFHKNFAILKNTHIVLK